MSVSNRTKKNPSTEKNPMLFMSNVSYVIHNFIQTQTEEKSFKGRKKLILLITNV